jgi:hypothetical protein
MLDPYRSAVTRRHATPEQAAQDLARIANLQAQKQQKKEERRSRREQGRLWQEQYDSDGKMRRHHLHTAMTSSHASAGMPHGMGVPIVVAYPIP